MAAAGAPTRGPFRSSRTSGCAAGRPSDMQRQAPRRHVSLRALVGQIAIDERVGHQALQVVRRLALHARGDFFAEQFEKEIGHFNGPE